MSIPTFSSVAGAVEYMESPAYRHGSEIAHYGGRRVLLVLQLDPTGKEEYLRIKTTARKRIWKEVIVSGTKDMGLDAAKVLYKSSKGDIFGTLASMFSLVRGTSSSNSDGIEDRISSSSADGALYLRFEKIFMRRSVDPSVYKYAKDKLGLSDARFTERREGELDGKYTFMYTL